MNRRDRLTQTDAAVSRQCQLFPVDQDGRLSFDGHEGAVGALIDEKKSAAPVLEAGMGARDPIVGHDDVVVGWRPRPAKGGGNRPTGTDPGIAGRSRPGPPGIGAWRQNEGDVLLLPDDFINFQLSALPLITVRSFNPALRRVLGARAATAAQPARIWRGLASPARPEAVLTTSPKTSPAWWITAPYSTPVWMLAPGSREVPEN